MWILSGGATKARNKRRNKHVDTAVEPLEDQGSNPCASTIKKQGENIRKNVLQGVLSASFLAAAILSFQGHSSAVPIKGPMGEADYPATAIDNTIYVPLVGFCEVNGIEWEWDPVSLMVTLKDSGREASLLVGSSLMRTGDRVGRMEKAPRMSRGAMVVPVDAGETVVAYLKGRRHEPPGRRTAPAVRTQEQKHGVRKIVIDPGHGGKDTGAIGKNGLREKDVVLDVSRRLRSMLAAWGIETVMTRYDDRFIPLSDRGKVANDIQADFFVSVHANSVRKGNASGFEVYYLSEAIDDNARAIEAAENAVLSYETPGLDHMDPVKATLWDMLNTENRAESVELAQAVCNAVSGRGLSKSRGVKRANFYVLRGAKTPAILVEIGFLSNRGEEQRMRSASFRQAVAAAIAEGILAYKQAYEATDGFTR